MVPCGHHYHGLWPSFSVAVIAVAVMVPCGHHYHRLWPSLLWPSWYPVAIIVMVCGHHFLWLSLLLSVIVCGRHCIGLNQGGNRLTCLFENLLLKRCMFVWLCSRYNLAKIQYHPALEFSWLYTSVLTDRSIELEVNFIRDGYIGGRLAERHSTTPGRTYIVDRDASVMGLGGELYIKPGTVLEFSNALGMLVEGFVHFEGTKENPITLRLRNESTWINSTRVRLVDGPSLLEGRLEVRPTEDDEWGTVCRDVSSLNVTHSCWLICSVVLKPVNLLLTIDSICSDSGA